MSKEAIQLLLGYLLLVNLAAFSLMGLDKRRARRDKWRISEKRCFSRRCWAGVWGPLRGCACFTTRRSTGTSGTACPPFLAVQLLLGVFLGRRLLF